MWIYDKNCCILLRYIHAIQRYTVLSKVIGVLKEETQIETAPF